MRGLRYILIVLTILSYRGLSAQEFDLYDFRYYKRFESVEELLAPEKDSTTLTTPTLNRQFSTRALDFNLSFIRYAKRGIPFYNRRTTLNGLRIPAGNTSYRALQLAESHDTEETRLRIDSIKRNDTSAGIFFSSKGLPYSLRLHSAQRLCKGWSLAASLEAKTGRDLHVDGLFGNSLQLNAVATKTFSDQHLFSMAFFANPYIRSTRLASTKEAFKLTGNYLYNPAL